MREKLNILLVEDNPNDVEYMYEMISEIEESYYDDMEYSFKVTPKSNIKDAIEYIDKQNDVRIILLDLSLPDSRDLEGLTRLKGRVFEIPVIILTGLNDNQKAIEALGKGAQDYLVKGKISPDLLIRSIRYSMERHKLISTLRNLSIIDELTNLYNRRGFSTLADYKMKLAKRERRDFLVFFIDLDEMKYINDKFGHNEGDSALSATAMILKKSFRDSDTIARVGGDEFAVLAFPAEEHDEDAIRDRIIERVVKYNNDSEKPYELSLSIGCVHNKIENQVTIDILLSKADENMYKNKRERKERAI